MPVRAPLVAAPPETTGSADARGAVTPLLRRLALVAAAGSALAALAAVGAVLRASRAPPRAAVSGARAASSVSLAAAGRCGGDSVECPRYPEPYKHGEWPEAYRYSGSFPRGFVWGVGTAAYQIEGAYREGGRGASIWETFTGADTIGMPGANCSYCCRAAPCPVHAGMFAKGATGNVACNHYRAWRSDVALMKSMGLKHYRFSISWPRLVPTGRVSDGISKEAIVFYNNLIDALVVAGINPYVTLYHWDLPQGLMDPPRVAGWWSRDSKGRPNGQIQPDWLDYADACFRLFGDRVKLWITFNEAFTFTFFGSGLGKAPSHPNYSNLSVDPYIAGHNVLNAHAAAVHLYRKKYQIRQGGKIGITNNCDWHEPLTDDPDDIAAAERATLFQLGWLSEPIFGKDGDYPPEMRKAFGDELPKFTKKQRRLLRGSADFFGLNHYATSWARYAPRDCHDHVCAKFSQDGLPQGQSVWLYGAAWGFRKMLNWVDRRYRRPPIYVTESGWSLDATTAEAGALDAQRVSYFANYTSEMYRAISEDGVDVRGYFAWSLMDNFEWERGYVERFGVVYTDFEFGMDRFGPAANFLAQPTAGSLARRRKDSSCWLEAAWRGNRLLGPEEGRCPTAAPMNGSYTDSRHPHCQRHVVFYAGGKPGQVFGTDGNGDRDCTGVPEVMWGPLPVRFSGTTIVVDFSRKGGSRDYVGYWNSAERVIEWSDGRAWTLKRGGAGT